MSTVLRRSGAQTVSARSIDDLIARLQRQIIFSRLFADRSDARELVATSKFLRHALRTLKQLDRDFERAMAPTRTGQTPNIAAPDCASSEQPRASPPGAHCAVRLAQK